MYTNVFATALANNNKKIKFKDNSPLRDFVTQDGLIRNSVSGTNTMATLACIKEIYFENIKKKYNWYKGIQGALKGYTSGMYAFIEEVLRTNDEANIVEFKLNRVLSRLLEDGKISPNLPDGMSSLKYDNQTESLLINKGITDEALINLTTSPYDDEDSINNWKGSLEEVRKLVLKYLDTLPVEGSNDGKITEIMGMCNSTTPKSIDNAVLLYIVVCNLIDNVEDRYLADGVGGKFYLDNIIPALEKLKLVMGVSLANIANHINENVKNGVLIHLVNSNTVFVHDENYKKYLEEFGKIEGAVDSLLIYIHDNDESRNGHYSKLGADIPLRYKRYQDQQAIKGISDRNKVNVRIAEEFVRGQLAMIEEVFQDGDTLEDTLSDESVLDKIPTPNELVNIAYNELANEKVLNADTVREICFKLVEATISAFDPYIGVFVTALCRVEFEGKELASSSRVLAAIMDVAATMIIDELEIVDA